MSDEEWTYDMLVFKVHHILKFKQTQVNLFLPQTSDNMFQLPDQHDIFQYFQLNSAQK